MKVIVNKYKKNMDRKKQKSLRVDRNDQKNIDSFGQTLEKIEEKRVLFYF